MYDNEIVKFGKRFKKVKLRENTIIKLMTEKFQRYLELNEKSTKEEIDLMRDYIKKVSRMHKIVFFQILNFLAIRGGQT